LTITHHTHSWLESQQTDYTTSQRSKPSVLDLGE
jgi:hypothetical protein